jgi:hypothetical protein
MADDKQSGPGLGGSSILVLLAAAASAVYVGWRGVPLVSIRPTEPPFEISQTKGAQDIEARLWQDPFAAVERWIEDRQDQKLDPDAGHSFEDVSKHWRPKPTLFIGVDLPGDPYPEAVETRRRLRYAVLSALHVAKYVPGDERHIGYLSTEGPKLGETEKPETLLSLRFPVARPAGSDPPAEGVFKVLKTAASPREKSVVQSDPPLRVPFERYEYEAANAEKRAVVLWLDEKALADGQKPIANLALLLCRLKLSDKGNFAFIGPQDSNVLQLMVREVLNSSITSRPLDKCPEQPAAKSLPDDLPLYNFAASAEDEIVLQHSNAGAIDVKALFRRAHIRYYRTISSDRDLAEVLAKELVGRGIDLCIARHARHGDELAGLRCKNRPHGDHVVLLSEWDTVYGRYLPESVSAAFAADQPSRGGCRLEPSRWIFEASYARGLDGRLPSRGPAKREVSADRDGVQTNGEEQTRVGGQTRDEESSATPETASRFEGAEGQSQFDYLRRLTDALRECDDELRREGKGRIAAIGILGSDVYDKLLLLQALGPEFPEAIFFTTDLDALLLPQKKLRYTPQPFGGLWLWLSASSRVAGGCPAVSQHPIRPRFFSRPRWRSEMNRINGLPTGPTATPKRP